MISTSSSLERELNKINKRDGDGFITVLIDGYEYVIDSIVHMPTHPDSSSTHIALKCRDGGNGYIRR